MTWDTGNAPCVTDIDGNRTGILSLACCKGGQIRHYKDRKSLYVNTGLRKMIGENFIADKEKNLIKKHFIVGIKKNRIIYSAEITDVLEMSEYFENCEYHNRMDCIYEPTLKHNYGNEGYESKLKRRENFNEYFHGDSIGCNDTAQANEQHIRDELGMYVLLSKKFSYFGGSKDVIINNTIMMYMPKRQETKIYRPEMDGYKEISAYVEELTEQGFVSDKPTDKLDENCCTSKKCQK